ncbi:MAG: cell wall-binding repeat-containing protein [Actinomycetia bacterium]|nr:cell wall-binding repeat-containing protein [Actinomycetes bacterium]
MGHSATSVDATRRWGVRTAVLLITGIVFVAVLIVLMAHPASAATCDINGTAVTTLASQPECDALVALYATTDGPNWDINTGWNTPTDPCGWFGVTCAWSGGIRELSLYRNSLAGAVPPEIGGLDNLVSLQLAENQLTSIPSQIGDLDILNWLYLGENQLTSIPPQIIGLSSLTWLILSGNQLASLPAEIGWLSNLTTLGLSRNELTSLPVEIGGLSNLTHLYINGNQLPFIPAGVGFLANLKQMYAQSNLMSGNLTASMSQLQDTITHLHFSDGPGGNNCLTTTDSGLSTWLTSLDADWDECAVVDVVVVGGSSVVSDAVLTELEGLVDGSVTRVWGANRYATAAALSNANFSPGVSSVFIATGENFPDALAAGPAAGRDGSPILLVRQNSVPGETAAELTRLHPGRIVVVGGSAVVSDAVMTVLGSYTSGTVTRVSGANRYATAAAVSAATFSPGVSPVFIATGENFPDALAGGPAGVVTDGPILLVRENSVPVETAAELARLNPGGVVVLGGSAVVSSSVVTELESMVSGCVLRYWGANRYETAVAVSERVFPTGASTVFIVTGVNFPDAVAAGPVAGIMDAPILLVTGTSVPAATGSELTRLAQ